ncbi:MAG: glycosyltransferase family 4 protein [Chloroflexota bacterium]|nr:glycosyltransferase family 4 protein [Chloroflexota bacterium]
MRVLFISGEYPPMQGGVGDYTWALGTALSGLGVEVHVLSSMESGPAHLVPRGVADVYPEIESWGWSLSGETRRLVQEIEPDVVHIQYQSAAYGLHPAINLLPRRIHGTSSPPQVAVTFHDLRVPYLFPKAGPLRWRANMELARNSDLVVVTNAEDRLRLEQQADLLDRLYEIPIGANIQPEPPASFDREQQRAKWDVAQDDLLLCYFGFLNVSKGGEELVGALKHLVADGVPAQLLMIGGQVGSSDPTNLAYLERVEKLISDEGLAERVHWTGFVAAEEVSASFLASDIAMLPYRDGASFRRGSLMAALVHELSIVSTEPAVPVAEMVQGENIWLVPPQDSQALARAAEHLWNDPELRQRLSVGANRLAGQFTWDAIARRHLEVYRELF